MQAAGSEAVHFGRNLNIFIVGGNLQLRNRARYRLKLGVLVALAVGALGSVGVTYTGALRAAPPGVSDRVVEYLATPPAPPAELPYMAVVGDSFSLDKPEYWHQRTARCINHQVVVSAIGGSGFAQAGKNNQTFDFPDRIAAVSSVEPDLIVFATAFNDAAYTLWQPDVVSYRIAETIQSYRVRNPHAKMIVLGPFWAIDPLPPMITKNRELLAQVAADNNVVYVDSSTWVRDPADLATNDGQHPTASGHQLIADKLLAAMSQAGLFTPNEACEI